MAFIAADTAPCCGKSVSSSGGLTSWSLSLSFPFSFSLPNINFFFFFLLPFFFLWLPLSGLPGSSPTCSFSFTEFLTFLSFFILLLTLGEEGGLFSSFAPESVFHWASICVKEPLPPLDNFLFKLSASEETFLAREKVMSSNFFISVGDKISPQILWGRSSSFRIGLGGITFASSLDIKNFALSSATEGILTSAFVVVLRPFSLIKSAIISLCTTDAIVWLRGFPFLRFDFFGICPFCWSLLLSMVILPLLSSGLLLEETVLPSTSSWLTSLTAGSTGTGSFRVVSAGLLVEFLDGSKPAKKRSLSSRLRLLLSRNLDTVSLDASSVASDDAISAFLPVDFIDSSACAGLPEAFTLLSVCFSPEFTLYCALFLARSSDVVKGSTGPTYCTLGSLPILFVTSFATRPEFVTLGETCDLSWPNKACLAFDSKGATASASIFSWEDFFLVVLSLLLLDWEVVFSNLSSKEILRVGSTEGETDRDLPSSGDVEFLESGDLSFLLWSQNLNLLNMECFALSLCASKDCAFLKLLLCLWRRAGSAVGSGLGWQPPPDDLSVLELLVKDNIPGIETLLFTGGREGLGPSESKSLDSPPDLLSLLAKYFPGTENFRGISGVVFESLEKENNLPGPEIFRFGDVLGDNGGDGEENSFSESFEPFREKSPEPLLCNLSSSSSESVDSRDFFREKIPEIFLTGLLFLSSLTEVDPVLALRLWPFLNLSPVSDPGLCSRDDFPLAVIFFSLDCGMSFCISCFEFFLDFLLSVELLICDTLFPLTFLESLRVREPS